MTALNWALADSTVLTGRYVSHLRRQPEQIATAVGFPILIMLMFVYLLGGMMAVPGGGDYTAALLPGLFTMTTLEFPVAFLSGVFVAPASMPVVVSTIAEWNPLSATAAATRELFGNPGWGGESWVAQHAVLAAVLWPLLIVAVFAPLSVRRYREMSR